ncbi:MAG: GNAT family N-acetyltransferase, partial [Blastocatellia bacterium]
AHARTRACRTISLCVNKRNTEAIAVYRRMGFAIRSAISVDIGGGYVMDDYVMEKRLSLPTE